MGALGTKELLVYVPFTAGALDTCVSFLLLITKGPNWALAISPNEADRPAFQSLWELFLVAYEGYFGFTLSTLACIYQFPETIPCFGYSLFALYGYKLYALHTKKLGGAKDDQHKMKINSVLLFYLPGYGGYCALHAMYFFGKNK